MYSMENSTTTAVSSPNITRVDVGFICTPGSVERIVRKALSKDCMLVRSDGSLFTNVVKGQTRRR